MITPASQSGTPAGHCGDPVGCVFGLTVDDAVVAYALFGGLALGGNLETGSIIDGKAC